MKTQKTFKTLLAILFICASHALYADVVYNGDPHNVGSWNAKVLTSSEYPALLKASEGDVIAISVIAAEDEARIMLQSTNWQELECCNTYNVQTGKYAFAVTAGMVDSLKNGVIITGQNYTFDKVEILYQKTIWTGEVNATTSWEQSEMLDNSIFSGLKAGDFLAVTVSEIHPGDWHLYAIRAAWRTNIIEQLMTTPGTGVHMLDEALVDSLQNQQIVIVGSYLSVTALHTYTVSKSVGNSQNVWEGEKVIGSTWSDYITIPASAFASAQEGQLLRVKYKDVKAGAQLKVGRLSDWDVMDDTQIVSISGSYHDFTITAAMLTELQARGMIVNGYNFTLTAVQVLNPSDLRPLELSVPVTDNWVFNDKPSIAVRMANPYDEDIEAHIALHIHTDRMEPVVSITDTVLLAAGSEDQVTLTTLNDLQPGFYQATCLVNDDMARSFVFAINPDDIVSAPDKQADFDEYWATALAQLNATPINATLTEIPSKSSATRKIYLVEMQSVADGLSGEPVTIRGYYAQPTDGKKHPVIMHYLGYDSGYRPGGQDVKPYCPDGGTSNYAEFYLSTRGQSINNRLSGEREADGKGDFTNSYGDWFAYEFGNKDAYYYRGAYMDCVRAIQFMAEQPTSDMNNLFAEGQSQGGAFTYAAAALSGYTFQAIAPAVAFMGDFPDYFQITNWPAYVAQQNQGSMTDQQMYAFLSYYDTKNLATKIACPVIACIGLQDNVCPPHTNLAPYNNLLSTDTQLIFNPENAHQVANSWYNDYMEFFANHVGDDTTTSTEQVESNTNQSLIRYNLLGQEVSASYHGIVICNGKKQLQ